MGNINSGRSVVGCINRNIGTAYDNVKKVADDIDNVNKVADNLDKIDNVLGDLPNVDVVADNILNINLVADNVEEIDVVAENISDVTEVANNMPAVKSAYDWAVSPEPVDDNEHPIDESSKTYAGQSKDSAISAKESEAVVNYKTTEFNLSYLGKRTDFPDWPLKGALMAYVGDDAPHGSYMYLGEGASDNNGWLFASNPPTEEVGIEPQHLVITEATDTFTLSRNPVSLMVYINGVFQEPDTYSITGSVVTTDETWPVGTSIVFQIFYAVTMVGGIIPTGSATADDVYNMTGETVGEAWFITEDGTLAENSDWLAGSTSIWTASNSWSNVTVQGIPGPQGAQGPKGDKGDTGYVQAQSVTITSDDVYGNSVDFTIPTSVNYNVTVQTFRNGIIQDPSQTVLVGSTITFTDEDFTPEDGDVFIFIYTEAK